MAGGNKDLVKRGKKRKAETTVYVELQRPSKRQTTEAETPKPSTSKTHDESLAEEASSPSSTPFQPTQQFRVPTEPTGIDGVFTDDVLSQLHLGLLVEYGILYCTSCNHKEDPKLPLGIPAPTTRNHLWKFHKIPWSPKLAALLGIVQTEYKIWPGESHLPDHIPPPVPSEIVAPFSHLPILTRDSFSYGPYICPLCQTKPEGDVPPCILTAKSTAQEHMLKKHKVSIATLKHTEWDICPETQSFHSINNSRRYFRVNSALAPSTHLALPSTVATLQKYLNSIYTRDIVTPTMAPPEGLTRERPFLHQQQWPKHLEKEDPADLVALVEYPTDANDPRLSRLGRTCRALLKRYMGLFEDMDSQVLRAWLDSDLKTGYSRGFVPLGSNGAIKSYSRFFTRFICLILRTYLRRKASNSSRHTADKPRYVAYLTAGQEACAKHLLRMLDSKSSDGEVEQAIHDLAVSCFAPIKPAEMTRRKYNNINYVFIMLSSVKSDGSYAPSGDIVTATSALQYMFRIILLKQAMHEADEPNADEEQCVRKYLAYLHTDDIMHPFSALKSLRRQLMADAASHRGLGLFHWADIEKTMGVYQGKNIPMAGVQNMWQAMYLKTKQLLDVEVLKSLPYDVLRIHELRLDALRDVLDESSYRYSVWRDVANTVLHSIRDSLIAAFITHPTLEGHFYRTTRRDGSPRWDNAARNAWLEKVAELSLHLLGCVQMSSGLSRRGREMVKMRNHNVQTRLRNLFKYGEYLIYILGYSKTTAQTGKDRLDVHALPSKISDMLLIFNTIVRPVAVQWLKELDMDDRNEPRVDVEASNEQVQDDLEDAGSEGENNLVDEDGCYEDYDDDNTGSEYNDGPPGRKEQRSKSPTPRYKPTFPPKTPRYVIQDELTFSKSGKPFTSDDLSRLFRSFSETHIGIPLGIQSWRHIQEVIHRDLLGYNFEESDDYEDTFFHLQAGHTAKIAALFYAVKDGDRTLEASESVIKYITASKAMQAWLDREPLPPIPGPAAKIATQLNNIENSTNRVSSRLSSLESKLGFTTEGSSQSGGTNESFSSTQESSFCGRLDRMEARLRSLEDKFDKVLELLLSK